MKTISIPAMSDGQAVADLGFVCSRIRNRIPQQQGTIYIRDNIHHNLSILPAGAVVAPPRKHIFFRDPKRYNLLFVRKSVSFTLVVDMDETIVTATDILKPRYSLRMEVEITDPEHVARNESLWSPLNFFVRHIHWVKDGVNHLRIGSDLMPGPLTSRMNRSKLLPSSGLGVHHIDVKVTDHSNNPRILQLKRERIQLRPTIEKYDNKKLEQMIRSDIVKLTPHRLTEEELDKRVFKARCRLIPEVAMIVENIRQHKLTHEILTYHLDMIGNLMFSTVRYAVMLQGGSVSYADALEKIYVRMGRLNDAKKR